MRRLTKRLFLMLSLTALAAVAFGGASAQAATSGTCVFTGLAGSITGPGPGVPPIIAGPLGSGTYTFQGDSPACVILNTAGNPVATGTAHITSSGSYQNVLCGTGTATGTAQVAFNNGQTFNVGYTIAFASGVGALAVTSGATGGGEVTIVPGDVPQPVGNGSGGNCITTGVTAFQVYGAFTAVV